MDNRGRRKNLHSCGIPELVEPDLALQTLMNNYLERPQDSPLEFESAHQVLCPRGHEGDPLRDIVCCFVDYRLKEEVAIKAQEQKEFSFNGSEVKIFQNLSQITLNNRRALQPILATLRERNMAYKWHFPFGLCVTVQGRSFTLQTPVDLPQFFEHVNLAPISVPDWYQEFCIPEIWKELVPPDPEQHTPHCRPNLTPYCRRGQGMAPAAPSGEPKVA